MTPKVDAFVSVIVPVYEVQENFLEQLTNLSASLKKSFTDHEIVIATSIENRDTDTFERLLGTENNVNIFYVNGPYKEDISWIVGLENCIGDFIVMFDPSTDPSEIILPAVLEAKSQDAIVYGIKEADFSIVRKIFYGSLYALSGIRVPENISRFRVLNRGIVNFMLRGYDRHKLFRIAPAISLTKHILFPYKALQKKSSLKSSGFFADLGTAWYTILATSIVPLRLVTLLSLLASLLSMTYGLYVFYVAVTQENVMRGWTSTSLQSAGMFFLLFLLLAILSEYIFQIIQSSRNAPLYFIAKEQSSSVYINKDRLNVIKE